ncbi:VWA domain-containing protein [Bacteroidota bacterium]
MFFRFENIEALYLLLLIPVLIIVFIIIQLSRKRSINQFGQPELLKELMPDASLSRPILKFIVLLFALSALIFTIARPQFGSKLKEVKRRGVEIMIALDVSNSMLAEDIKPNRLERAKRAIANMVNKLDDDKIGLIVFAGDAYVQVPITTDYISTKMFLNSINPSLIPKQGTTIGAAIDLATRSFSTESELSKAIIIITDGENHESDAVEAARAASEKGIIVHTLGMGLPQGAPVPIQGYNNYLKDRQGNTVISKLNEQMLQQIAVAGNGAYIRANNTETGLNTLFNEINKMEEKEIETKVYSDYEDHYQLIAGIALFFILLEIFILERKNKFLKNIKLFKI